MVRFYQFEIFNGNQALASGNPLVLRYIGAFLLLRTNELSVVTDSYALSQTKESDNQYGA